MIQTGLLFFVVTAFVACLGAMIVGMLAPPVSLAALCSGILYCYFDRRFRTLKISPRPTSLWVKILYAFILGGIYAHSIFLFYLKEPTTWWIQNASNLGDLSFHFSAIRNLARGAHFWPENPIFLGFRFRYPFGMDLFNALFENLGVAIQTHLPLVTFFGLLLTLAALHVAGGPLLVFTIFFSAGFYNFLQAGSWDIHKLQDGLDFKNLFLSVLINQRGFVYALPAGVFLWKAFNENFFNEWKPGRFEKISLGLIWGGLGFFHLHSFFIVSLFLGLLILWQKRLRTWWPSVLIAFFAGLPFVLNALLPEAGLNGFIRWSRGWNRSADVNYFTYWIRNVGPWLVVVAVALVVFYRAKNWQKLVPLAIATALFALFAHLILAPWEWDNIKLLVWCYVFALLTIQDFLWNDRPDWFRAGVFIIFCWPGFLLFLHSLPHATRGTAWVSERELNKARILLEGINVNDGMVVAPDYDHPVLVLGQKLYLGYIGHVWSHGYNHVERESRIRDYFAGNPEATAAFPKDQVRWFYRGPLEKRREKPEFSTKGLSKVGEALDHELYRFE